jgi:hypothetical protein
MRKISYDTLFRRISDTMRFCILALTCASAFGQSLSPAAWREDLEVLARELPARHKNMYYTLKKEQFASETAKIAAQLPTLSEAEIRVALARLVALVGNAHTGINALSGAPQYPIRFYEFPDGFYVVGAAAENREAIGARLLSIAGVPAADVVKRLLPLIPMETPMIEKIYMPGLLRNAYALGTESAAFRFDKDGRQFDLALRAAPNNQQPSLESTPSPVPLYLSDRASAYWFRYLENGQTLYIQYNRCQDVKQHPFAEFTREAMAAADAHPIENVVLDLRHNGGGNSQVIDPLVAALKARPRLTRKDHFFVLTSRETFSSGFMAELQMKQVFKARIAGEASAQRPNSYGDVRTFQLPNSKLEVRYCTKFFKLASHGDPDALMPDIPVELTARDYFAGRDPVLERALRP